MFVFSKIFWWIFEPSNLIVLILIVGAALLWSRRWRLLGRRIISFVALFLVFISFVPLGDLLITPLEDRFPQVKELPENVVGIITLGGAVNQYATKSRDSISLNRNAERLTEAVALTRRYPALKLVYTGGSGSLIDPTVKETLVARRFFHAMGVAPDRVTYEGDSRNTRENATLTRRLIAPRPGEKWVLVTSAIHMPRSVGVFRKAGWDVVPYPVSYITYQGDHRLWKSPISALGRLSLGMHEWIGLIAYRLLGWSDVLFPAP